MRLSSPWVILVCFGEGYTVPHCPLFARDKQSLYKLVVRTVPYNIMKMPFALSRYSTVVVNYPKLDKTTVFINLLLARSWTYADGRDCMFFTVGLTCNAFLMAHQYS